MSSLYGGDGVDNLGDVQEISESRGDEDEDIEYMDSSEVIYVDGDEDGGEFEGEVIFPTDEMDWDEDGGEFGGDVFEHEPANEDDIDRDGAIVQLQANTHYDREGSQPKDLFVPMFSLDEGDGVEELGDVREISALTDGDKDEGLDFAESSEVIFFADDVDRDEDGGEFEGEAFEHESSEGDYVDRDGAIVELQAEAHYDSTGIQPLDFFEPMSPLDGGDGVDDLGNVKEVSESNDGDEGEDVVPVSSPEIVFFADEVDEGEDGGEFESEVFEHEPPDSDDINRDGTIVPLQGHAYYNNKGSERVDLTRGDERIEGEPSTVRNGFDQDGMFAQHPLDYGTKDIESILTARLKRSGGDEDNAMYIGGAKSDSEDGAI